MAADEARAVNSRAFRAYGIPPKMLTSFNYLGRVLSVVDNEWMEVVRNIVKALVVRHRMSRILSSEGARLRVSIFFFKSVIQLVLLFGAET